MRQTHCIARPSQKLRSPRDYSAGFRFYPGDVLLFHAVASAVPSALEGLTTVFGMGTGVTPPLWSPGNSSHVGRQDTRYALESELHADAQREPTQVDPPPLDDVDVRRIV